jgi:hypothetical protein
MREHGTGQRGWAEQVHLEERSQLGVGRLLERSDMRAPCVVDQHVNPTVPLKYVSAARYRLGQGSERPDRPAPKAGGP